MKRAAIIIAFVVLTGLSGRLIDFPKVAGGFKGDEATYVLQTFSLIEDFDLNYEQRDLLRFGRLYGEGRGGRPVGPNGIFLKQTSQSTPASLEYAKAFAYALVAAPFAMLGGLGGMFLLNVAMLVLCAWCAAVFAAARVGSPWGWAIGLLFVAASSVPVWAVWLMPEVFNFTLVFVGYCLWLYKEVRPADKGSADDFLGGVWSDVAAACLIGVAAYSKITNIPLIAPLLVHALWRRNPQRAAIVAAAFAISLGGWFGANVVVTGEANYQGGLRKTFYGHYPFDADASTFKDALNSNDMATGTTAEPAASKVDPQTGLSTDILFPGHPHFWPLFATNAGYFLVGRDAGLIPYYFPGALLLAMWLLKIRRTEAWQVWAFAAAAGTALILIVMTPYTWNGGGGPPGNRYFLSAYPALFFLLPATTGAWTAIAAGLGGMAFLWPLFGHPFLASKQPWLHPQSVPLRLMPVELTLMDDLPARLLELQGRARVPFGRPERNAMLYLMDFNTYDAEQFDGRDGYWIAGDASTEIVVRTSFRNARIQLAVSAPIANSFTASWGGSKCALELKPDEWQTCDLVASRSAWAHGGEFYSLKMSTTKGFVPLISHPPSTDPRNLGVKVVPVVSER